MNELPTPSPIELREMLPHLSALMEQILIDRQIKAMSPMYCVEDGYGEVHRIDSEYINDILFRFFLQNGSEMLIKPTDIGPGNLLYFYSFLDLPEMLMSQITEFIPAQELALIRVNVRIVHGQVSVTKYSRTVEGKTMQIIINQVFEDYFKIHKTKLEIVRLKKSSLY